MQPAPLVFAPILKQTVWGGDHLREVAGRPIAPGSRIGESWELSDRPGDMSVVADGPKAGRTLAALMRREREQLLGKKAAAVGERFPLLIKLIDAAETLSVQVHPDDAYAAAHGLGEYGKRKAVDVLRARRERWIFLGLRPGVTREAFARLVRADRAADALGCFVMRQGDVLFCPPGTGHAIGAGLVLVEIQRIATRPSASPTGGGGPTADHARCTSARRCR